MGSVVIVTLTEAFVANQRREAALYRRYHSFYTTPSTLGGKGQILTYGKQDPNNTTAPLPCPAPPQRGA